MGFGVELLLWKVSDREVIGCQDVAGKHTEVRRCPFCHSAVKITK